MPQIIVEVKVVICKKSSLRESFVLKLTGKGKLTGSNSTRPFQDFVFVFF